MTTLHYNMYQHSFCLGNQGIYQGIYLFGFPPTKRKLLDQSINMIYVSPETLVNKLE